MHNLGKQGKDKITGFEGVIVGKANYLCGLEVYCITSETEDSRWLGIGQVEIIGECVADIQAKEPACMDIAAPNNCIR